MGLEPSPTNEHVLQSHWLIFNIFHPIPNLDSGTGLYTNSIGSPHLGAGPRKVGSNKQHGGVSSRTSQLKATNLHAYAKPYSLSVEIHVCIATAKDVNQVKASSLQESSILLACKFSASGGFIL